MMISNFQLLPPTDWQAFERLCHWLWMDILKDPDAQRNGRQGQPQAGVDVYGIDQSTGRKYGIQCKGKTVAFGLEVTEKELRTEIDNAKKFSPALDVFILATTAPNDEAIQRLARNISQEHEKIGLFKVLVYGWGAIESHIPFSPRVISEIYPHYDQKNSQIENKIDNILKIVTDGSNKQTQPKSVEPIFANRESTAASFKTASENLFSWPRTLQSNNLWIERKEQDDIFIKFDNQNNSTTIVLGDPGTGKSALLSKISYDLSCANELTLAIKADYLDNEISDFTSLAKDLNLPGPIDKCILEATQYGPVYLIIDQLDTLSELIDVKTQRLSVLLNLIRQLSGLPNVHILASSRPFEFRWDGRLNNLKADKLQLPDLQWQFVSDILSAEGVTLLGADNEFKSFLCRPNNLNFYLTYLKKNPERAFSSHIELYDEIWRSSLGIGEAQQSRYRLLEEIARVMTNEAKQSLPVLKFEYAENEIDWLCAAGILVRINNRRSVAFAHQTLQAYVWTRSFVKETNSLIEFVLSHQNNLNIRPKLTTVLFYLRDADAQEYNKQIQEILIHKRFSVRNHIVHLVIECIGATADPNDIEVVVFHKLLSESFLRPRLINSITGKVNWFDKFSHAILSSLMSGSESDKYVSANLLSSVFDERKDAVVTLIEKHWMNVPDVNFIFYMLRGINTWDETALKFAKHLASHKDAHPNISTLLFHVISDKSPSGAIKYAGEFFKTRLEFIDSKYLEIFPDDETDTGLNWESERYAYSRQFETLAEMGSDWYNLPKLAEKEPSIFIEEFWNFFIKVCKRTKHDLYNDKHSYKETNGHWFHLSDEGRDHGDRYFSFALETSIKQFALQSPDRFKDLLHENGQNDSLLIQRTLAKGLVVLGAQMPEFVLNWLLEDTRRFKLGHMHDRYSGTREIISAIASNLSESGLEQLEDSILRYQAKEFAANRTPEGKKWDIQHNRKIVYTLLTAIPENLRSDKAKRLREQEERAFGADIKKGTGMAGYSGLLRQISPMSEEQMKVAKDDDIVKCFVEFPDGKETDWRTNDGAYFGSMEFAREFGRFAANNPERATYIVSRLDGKNIEAISAGLNGIASSNFNLHKLLELIEPLIAKYATAYFLEEVVSAIREKLAKSTSDKLDNHWCEIIESWLPALILRREEPDEIDSSSKKERQESILWNRDRTIFLPGGSFSVLDLLTLVYLNRTPPDVQKWVNMIKDHLSREDNLAVWYTFSILRLPWGLSRCVESDVEGIIDTLLHRFPAMLQRSELAHSLVQAIHSISDLKFYEWMNKLHTGNNNISQQMYGELVVAKALIHRQDQTATAMIDALIASPSTNINILTGIAFACRHEWRNFKELLTPYMVILLRQKNQQISSIILDILNMHEKIEPDHYLNTLLDAIIENETLTWLKVRIHFLPKLLTRLAHIEPDRVIILCNHLIESRGEDFGNISTSAAGESPDLISTAITLHNLGPEYQSKGLDIFERLIQLDAYQINEALQKIDGTPKIKIA